MSIVRTKLITKNAAYKYWGDSKCPPHFIPERSSVRSTKNRTSNSNISKSRSVPENAAFLVSPFHLAQKTIPQHKKLNQVTLPNAPTPLVHSNIAILGGRSWSAPTIDALPRPLACALASRKPKTETPGYAVGAHTSEAAIMEGAVARFPYSPCFYGSFASQGGNQ